MTQFGHRHGLLRGFTIIELMLVIVVLGVLALVALPSFMEQIRKGRRSEAVAALAQVQQSQERWRANRASYTSNLSDLSVGLSSGNQTASGYYVISIEDGANGNSYTATATAVSGTSQSQDTPCTVMRVRLQGGNLQYGGCAGCDLPAGVLTDPNRCWAR